MDVSTVISAVGLVLTISHNTAHAYKYQDIEGVKKCDFTTLHVLRKADNKIYLKMNNKVHVMYSRPTVKGNEKIMRFETTNGNLVLLQTPEKALVLDNVRMRPIYNECINSEV